MTSIKGEGGEEGKDEQATQTHFLSFSSFFPKKNKNSNIKRVCVFVCDFYK